ncbi:MAG: oligosaccharide flippase family protein [Elusimicrobia bacterium]|nr:oligosaccharide flippase family protein [Elusimicrobiota bacterium]
MAIFVNASALIFSSFLVKIVTVGTNFMTRRLLGPQLMGVWSLVQIAAGYMASISAGVQLGAEREIPFYRGKGQPEKEDHVRRLMFTTSLLEGVGVGGVFLAYLLRHFSEFPKALALGFIYSCSYVVLQRILGCFITAFRTSHDFVFLSKSEVLFACADLLLIVPSCYVWGFRGLLGSFGAGLLFRTAFWAYWVRRHKKFSYSWYWSWGEAIPVVRVGFPILVGSFTWQFLSSADSLVLARTLGVASLGFYSLGSTVARAVSDIPTRLSTVIFPRLVEKYGATEDVSALKSEVVLSLLALFLFLVPVVLAPAYFGSSFIVRRFLPTFSPGIPALKLLIFGSMFLPATQIPAQIFIARNKMWGLALMELGVGGAIAGSAWLASPWGLSGVAAVTIAGYAAFFSLTFFWVASRMMGRMEALKTYALLMGGAFYTILLIRLLDLVVYGDRPLGSFSSDLFRSGLCVLLAWGGMLPLYWKAEQTLNIRQHLSRFLSRKKGTA